ncbi:Type II toxin-antitoxin system RelE/ParE family toxin [Pseudomonas sp. IT-93MI4]
MCSSRATLPSMPEIIRSSTFSSWLLKLADSRARMRIQVRIDRMADGNFGDVKAVGEGLSEVRIDYGPGYRVYFMQQGRQVVILLCGGDKSSQPRDIKQARLIAESWQEQNP